MHSKNYKIRNTNFKTNMQSQSTPQKKEEQCLELRIGMARKEMERKRKLHDKEIEREIPGVIYTYSSSFIIVEHRESGRGHVMQLDEYETQLAEKKELRLLFQEKVPLAQQKRRARWMVRNVEGGSSYGNFIGFPSWLRSGEDPSGNVYDFRDDYSVKPKRPRYAYDYLYPNDSPQRTVWGSKNKLEMVMFSMLQRLAEQLEY